MIKGIYTLANDAVYDQLVALLNSIEANYGRDVAVCVIPYDDKTDLVRREIAKRSQVTLFDDAESIARWEAFAKSAWNIKPKVYGLRPTTWGRHRLGVHRKFCAFDGLFDRFVFMDADTLLMQPPDFVFDKLNDNDFVVYDYQFKDPGHVYNLKSEKLYGVFSEERISARIFCSGFFASRKGLFDEGKLSKLMQNLENGEADLLYPFAPEQSLLNYMLMRSDVSIYNFALDLPYDKRTGNSVTSTHFEEKEHILYDKGVRLTYLH